MTYETTSIGDVIPPSTNHATKETLIKPINGPIDKSIPPLPTRAIGVKAKDAKIKGVKTIIAPAIPSLLKSFGPCKNITNNIKYRGNNWLIP